MATRADKILKFVDKGARGIEVGPYFNPLVPKAAGWDVLVLDVFRTEQLRETARKDPNIPPERVSEIEDVDLVGPAHKLSELLDRKGAPQGALDFVVSSHNFEHLPDPIRFLQAVSTVLRPGGVLSMAVPDHRYCFDVLRPASTVGDMIEAYVEARERPSARQEFDAATLVASYVLPGQISNYFGDIVSERDVVVVADISAAFARWQDRASGAATDYRDAHCWLLTPARFGAILNDLRLTGLITLEILEISQPDGLEFYVHLRRPENASSSPPLARSEALRPQLEEALAGQYATAKGRLYRLLGRAPRLREAFHGVRRLRRMVRGILGKQ